MCHFDELEEKLKLIPEFFEFLDNKGNIGKSFKITKKDKETFKKLSKKLYKARVLSKEEGKMILG